MKKTMKEDLPQIIEEARTAQRAWSQVPVKTRAKRILPIRDYLVQYSDDIAHLIHQVTGKPRIDAFTTEVLSTANAVRYYTSHASKFFQVVFESGLRMISDWAPSPVHP